MEYSEALKKVQASKPKENMMLIQVAYDQKILVPYKDGIALMASLANAELLVEGYGVKTHIKGLEQETVRCATLSGNAYQSIKIATLLDVDLDALKQYETPS